MWMRQIHVHTYTATRPVPPYGRSLRFHACQGFDTIHQTTIPTSHDDGVSSRLVPFVPPRLVLSCHFPNPSIDACLSFFFDQQMPNIGLCAIRGPRRIAS
jgi:hypothetical protein